MPNPKGFILQFRVRSFLPQRQAGETTPSPPQVVLLGSDMEKARQCRCEDGVQAEWTRWQLQNPNQTRASVPRNPRRPLARVRR